MRPVALTVIVGVPIVVSLYLNEALLEPDGIATDVMFVVSPASRKVPVPESVTRFTATPPTPALTGLPAVSRC